MPEISFQLQTKNTGIHVILTNFDVKYNLQLCNYTSINNKVSAIPFQNKGINQTQKNHYL